MHDDCIVQGLLVVSLRVEVVPVITSFFPLGWPFSLAGSLEQPECPSSRKGSYEER